MSTRRYRRRSSALYALRREHLRRDLEVVNREYHIFDVIGLDDHVTIYNWSKLKAGEDALSLFVKTGIAGVSGNAFGYSDEYIRLSVGFIPIPAVMSNGQAGGYIRAAGQKSAVRKAYRGL